MVWGSVGLYDQQLQVAALALSQIPSNRGHKALNRGALGSIGSHPKTSFPKAPSSFVILYVGPKGICIS